MPSLKGPNQPMVVPDLTQAFQIAKHVSIKLYKNFLNFLTESFPFTDSIASSKKGPMTEKYSEINENDEWTAIQKFNTLLHFEEQKQAMLREEERKRLIRE